MITVFVEGVGLLGPGLCGWGLGRPVLAGEAEYASAEVVLPAIGRLPAAERRRTGAAVKLAVAVGSEALAQAGREADDMATVFTSSGGDGDTIDAILTVLATEQREISPTRFHNSVHNAPSGYWALAGAATAPSTSLCGFDGSFGVGLLDAAAQCSVDRRPVTLISYDLPYPAPLLMIRPITSCFGTALVLTPTRTERTLARLGIELRHREDGGDAEGSRLADAGLESLRRGNPSARSLPLLRALAGGEGCVALEGIVGALVQVEVAA